MILIYLLNLFDELCFIPNKEFIIIIKNKRGECTCLPLPLLNI